MGIEIRGREERLPFMFWMIALFRHNDIIFTFCALSKIEKMKNPQAFFMYQKEFFPVYSSTDAPSAEFADWQTPALSYVSCLPASSVCVCVLAAAPFEAGYSSEATRGWGEGDSFCILLS